MMKPFEFERIVLKMFRQRYFLRSKIPNHMTKLSDIYQLKTQVGFSFFCYLFCKCLVLEKASSAAKLDYDTNVSIMILLADRE